MKYAVSKVSSLDSPTALLTPAQISSNNSVAVSLPHEVDMSDDIYFFRYIHCAQWSSAFF